MANLLLAQTKLTSCSKPNFHTSQVPDFRSTRLFLSPKIKLNRLTSIKPRVAALPPSTGENIVIFGPKFDDPSLVSTWPHRACVASGTTAVLVSLVQAAAGAMETSTWLGPVLAGLAGYVLADLGTGFYHWGIDNYGDPSIPFLGPQIEKAQGHHHRPSTIARRQVANNLHAAALGVAVAAVPADLLSSDPTFHAFVGVFGGCVVLSQQCHAWAHETGGARLPPLVAALQDLGILLSPEQHAAHHVAGSGNDKGYCIVSGFWNDFLDNKLMIFRKMEMFLFSKYGVRPKSWDIITQPKCDSAEETTFSKSH